MPKFGYWYSVARIYFLPVLFLPALLKGHNLETGEAVLTLSADRVWILEMDINLTKYILSNPELADEVRRDYRLLEREGGLNGDNFNRWELLFIKCETQFRKEIFVLDSGEPFEEFEFWFPHPSELANETYTAMVQQGLHIKLNVAGRLTSRSSPLQFRFPVDIGEVILTTVRPKAQWIMTGEVSQPVTLGGSGIQLERTGFFATFGRYSRIGFIHIVPRGLDHILFLLGLFLLVARIKPLLIQITAFTAAHTLTLGLSIYGLVLLPSNWVEPLIALSITLVAIENVFTDKIRSWRTLVVFLFGLLHGLGFAGVLSEVGLPQGQFVTALISFNVGVEIGQLSVLLFAFVILGAFRNKGWYRKRLTIPISCLIGAVGLVWAIQRVVA